MQAGGYATCGRREGSITTNENSEWGTGNSERFFAPIRCSPSVVVFRSLAVCRTPTPVVHFQPCPPTPPTPSACSTSPRRAARPGDRLGPAGLPRRPALPVAVPAGRRRSGRDDEPAGQPARFVGERGADRPADSSRGDRLTRWPHHQDPLPPARRPVDRDRADALRPAQHRLHQQPGRLRHGLHLLRHRPDGPAAQPDAGRDHGAGAVLRALAAAEGGGREKRESGERRAGSDLCVGQLRAKGYG